MLVLFQLIFQSVVSLFYVLSNVLFLAGFSLNLSVRFRIVEALIPKFIVDFFKKYFVPGKATSGLM